MIHHSPQNTRIIPNKLRVSFPNILDPLANFCVRNRIRPNFLTLLALFAGLGAGLLFYLEKQLWAGILIIICGLLDILDGKVAVKSNRQTLFGAIFDSSLDRYSEFFVLFGLALYFRHHWAVWIIFWTFLGSAMVSYTRARAEGLGFDCKVGFMQRAERIILLALGTIIGVIFNVFNPVMIGVLSLIALVSNFTAIQRIFYVKKAEKKNIQNTQDQEKPL
jgi:CDP-diacylglycerol--glycerol-3-phosphate 3-phosphatidyltransferase